jgi:hypothetical protein
MANRCVFELKISGDRRNEIKDLFDQAMVKTDYGCLWELDEWIIRCIEDRGDGITDEANVVTIQGECNWGPDLTLVKKWSQQHPGVNIEISSSELQNHIQQRWIFREGAGRLIDYISAGYEGQPDIVYMRDGKQFMDLPQ